ncbi:EXPB5 [Linum grandiflorum]
MATMNRTLPSPMTLHVAFAFSLVLYLSMFRLASSSRPINDVVVARFNGSNSGEGQWSPAGATWYGGPDGDGSDGGACGYSTAVSQPPFSSMITAVGPSLYNSGKECGACYQVKCTNNPSCSGKPVRVVITDSCPGGPCASESAHFDLSGTAFGAMALPGQEGKLRDAGVLQVSYSRVPCEYSGKTVAFHVDSGSNAYYFAVVVEFEAGDGDLATVNLKQSFSSAAAPHQSDVDQWESMQQSWGAVWKLDAGNKLNPPFSIKLTSQLSGKTLVAKNVIPAGWQAGATYRSVVNF